MKFNLSILFLVFLQLSAQNKLSSTFRLKSKTKSKTNIKFQSTSLAKFKSRMLMNSKSKVRLKTTMNSQLKFKNKVSMSMSSKLKLQMLFKFASKFMDKSTLSMLNSTSMKLEIKNYIVWLNNKGRSKEKIKELSKKYFLNYMKNPDYRFKDMNTKFIEATKQLESSEDADIKPNNNENESDKSSVQSNENNTDSENNQNSENQSSVKENIQNSENQSSDTENNQNSENINNTESNNNSNINQNNGETDQEQPQETEEENSSSNPLSTLSPSLDTIIYKIELSDIYIPGKLVPSTLKPNVQKDLVASETNEENRDNQNLSSIPKPKVYDRPFYPDLLNPTLIPNMYPDEFFGLNNIQIYQYEDNKLKPFNTTTNKNEIYFSTNYLEIRGDGEPIIIPSKDFILSCLLLDAPVICNGTQFVEINPGFDKLMIKTGLSIEDELISYLESTKYTLVLKFENKKAIQQFKMLYLFLSVQNSSKTKTYVLEDKSTVTVDNNAGLITINKVSEDGDRLPDHINVNSIKAIDVPVNKSELTIAYIEEEKGDDDSVKSKLVEVKLKVPVKPEGYKPTSREKYWYIKELYKSLDTSMNIYYYYFLEQKKTTYMSGIPDLNKNYENNSPEVLYSFKYPLKILKYIDNQMGVDDCMFKNSSIVYFATLLSAQNMYILNELLYFYYVKRVLPSINPNFEGISFYNYLLFFNQEKCVETFNEDFTIQDGDLTYAMGHRWLYYINKKKCIKNENIEINDYKEIIKYDVLHFDWAYQNKYDVCRTESTYSLFTKKQSMDQLCIIYKSKLIIGHLVRNELLRSDYDTALINMIKKYPFTMIQVIRELYKQKDNIGIENFLILEEKLDQIDPSLELDPSNAMESLVKKINLIDLVKIFAFYGLDSKELSKFINIINYLIPKLENLFSLIPKEDSTKISKLIINSFSKNYNGLSIYLMKSNRNLILKNAETQHNTEVVNKSYELIENPDQLDSLLKDEGETCSKLENYGLNNICKKVDEEKSIECDDSLLKLLQNLLNKKDMLNNELKTVDNSLNINLTSECKPEMMNLIEKLDKDGLIASIKNTIELNKCKLAFIYIDELMKNDMIDEEQIKTIYESQIANEANFIQLKLQNKTSSRFKTSFSTKIQNKAKIKTKTRSKMKNIKDLMYHFVQNNQDCKPDLLKRKINQITTNNLSKDSLQKSLCSAMSNPDFLNGFKNANNGLFEEGREWWNMIPEKEYFEDVKNKTDAIEFTYSMYSCFAIFTNQLLDSSKIDTGKVIKKYKDRMQNIPENLKSKMDVDAEVKIAKSDNDSALIQEYVANKQLPFILQYSIYMLLKEKITDNYSVELITYLRKSEECTIEYVDYIKLINLKADDKFYKKVILSLPLDRSELKGNKDLIQSFIDCDEALNKEQSSELINTISNDDNISNSYTNAIDSKQIDDKVAFKSAWFDYEVNSKISSDYNMQIKDVFDNINKKELECTWTALVNLYGFRHYLKMQDPSLFENGNDSENGGKIDPEDESNNNLSSAEMRDKMLYCLNQTDSTIIAPMLSYYTTGCLADPESNSTDVIINSLAEFSAHLSDENKQKYEMILSSELSLAEKITQIINEQSIIDSLKEPFKEYMKETLSNKAIIDDSNVDCIFPASSEDKEIKECYADFGKINCIKNPEECEYLFDINCNKVFLEDECTSDQLKLISTIHAKDGQEYAQFDTSLTLKGGFCYYNDIKISTYSRIATESIVKFKVYDLRVSVEECDKRSLKIIARQAVESKRAEDICDENTRDEHGKCPSVIGLVDKLIGQMKDKISDLLGNSMKENIIEAMEHLNPDGMSKLNNEVQGGNKNEGNDNSGDGNGNGMTNRNDGQGGSGNNRDNDKSDNGDNGNTNKNNNYSTSYNQPDDLIYVNPNDPSESEINNPENKRQLEMWYYLQAPDSFSRSTGIKKEQRDILMKKVFLQQLAYAFYFDEYLSIVKRNQMNDINEINGIINLYRNIFLYMEDDSLQIKPNDNKVTVITKANSLIEKFTKYSTKDDLGGPKDANLDFTALHMKTLMEKYKQDTPTKISHEDLHTLVILVNLFHNTITQKPVFTMMVFNKLRKVDFDPEQIPENLYVGDDADYILNTVKKNGLANYGFLVKFKIQFSATLAKLISTLPAPDIESETADLVQAFQEMASSMSSLPGIIPVFLLYSDSMPKFPPVKDMKEAYQYILDLRSGLSRPKQFFLIEKIYESDKKGLEVQPMLPEVMKAVNTIKRFRVGGLVFRSLDVLKNIQKSLKGSWYDRNLVRDSLAINLMTKGDVFLDYVKMRYEHRESKIENKKEEEKKLIKLGKI